MCSFCLAGALFSCYCVVCQLSLTPVWMEVSIQACGISVCSPAKCSCPSGRESISRYSLLWKLSSASSIWISTLVECNYAYLICMEPRICTQEEGVKSPVLHHTFHELSAYIPRNFSNVIQEPKWAHTNIWLLIISTEFEALTRSSFRVFLPCPPSSPQISPHLEFPTAL